MILNPVLNTDFELKPVLKNEEDNIMSAFSSLSALIPGTNFIPIYYIIGVLGDFFAEPSPYGLMITISDLPEAASVLKLALVHETIHVQQALSVGI